jgi:hypothetical protein
VETQNDIGWNLVFSKLEVIEQIEKIGHFDITASDLKELASREPRHLAKIDHKQNRPKVFIKNDLNVLAISNFSYRIGNFNPFMDLPPWEDSLQSVKSVQPPIHLETLTTREISSENSVIYSAYASKMIEDFCGEEVVPTVSGRMRTNKFEFNVNGYDHRKNNIQVSGAQIEIDAGFEGKNGFHLFEVKNSLSSNFNLRQVYYPFAMWKDHLTKNVTNNFLTHSNDYFDFYQIVFANSADLSSASISRHIRYTLGDVTPSIGEYEKALSEISSINPENIPFPQADSFERIIDLVALLMDSPKTNSDLAENYDFDLRQSDYYVNAARYLGLVEKIGNGYYAAAPLALAIFSRPAREKNSLLMAVLSKVSAVLELKKAWDVSGSKPSIEEAIRALNLMPEAESLADSTRERRARTLLAWTHWLKTQLILAAK